MVGMKMAGTSLIFLSVIFLALPGTVETEKCNEFDRERGKAGCLQCGFYEQALHGKDVLFFCCTKCEELEHGRSEACDDNPLLYEFLKQILEDKEKAAASSQVGAYADPSWQQTKVCVIKPKPNEAVVEMVECRYETNGKVWTTILSSWAEKPYSNLKRYDKVKSIYQDILHTRARVCVHSKRFWKDHRGEGTVCLKNCPSNYLHKTLRCYYGYAPKLRLVDKPLIGRACMECGRKGDEYACFDATTNLDCRSAGYDECCYYDGCNNITHTTTTLETTPIPPNVTDKGNGTKSDLQPLFGVSGSSIGLGTACPAVFGFVSVVLVILAWLRCRRFLGDLNQSLSLASKNFSRGVGAVITPVLVKWCKNQGKVGKEELKTLDEQVFASQWVIENFTNPKAYNFYGWPEPTLWRDEKKKPTKLADLSQLLEYKEVVRMGLGNVGHVPQSAFTRMDAYATLDAIKTTILLPRDLPSTPRRPRRTRTPRSKPTQQESKTSSDQETKSSEQESPFPWSKYSL